MWEARSGHCRNPARQGGSLYGLEVPEDIERSEWTWEVFWKLSLQDSVMDWT